MDSLTIIAITSAVGGWGAFSYMLRSRDKFEDAYENERAENNDLTHALSLSEKQNDILSYAASMAGDEMRAVRNSNTALVNKCGDLSKQLIATRDALEASEELGRQQCALSEARYRQIEEMRRAEVAE